MKRWFLPALSVLLPAALALADGDGPVRKMTGPEAAAFDALKGAVQAALPKAPANYAFTFQDGSGSGGLMLPAALKPDQAASMSFKATYTLSRDFAAGEQRALFMDRVKGTPEQQAALAALDAKEVRLKEARDRTRDRGEKERIRAELKAVRDEASRLQDQVMADYQQWVAGGGAAAAAEAGAKALPAGELTVRVLANQDVSLNDKATPFKLPGFALAFEQSEGCQDVGTTCISVFMGAFDKEKRISGYTFYRLRRPSLGVTTKPRGLVLIVGGPKEKAETVRAFLGQVDLVKLRTLVP